MLVREIVDLVIIASELSRTIYLIATLARVESLRVHQMIRFFSKTFSFLLSCFSCVILEQLNRLFLNRRCSNI
jgi:hypothetical protein